MRLRAAALACVLAAAVAGCGSSSSHGSAQTTAQATTTARATAAAALAPLRQCFGWRGYTVQPDSEAALKTAERRFEFVTVWNLRNPGRTPLAVAISRSVRGATVAAAWTRREYKKIGRGVVVAPVVRFGKIGVLWTARPGPLDARDVYGCIRAHA